MAKRYPPKFKFQIVLELLQGEQSVGQLAKSYNVHPNSILKWKKELLTKGPEVFTGEIETYLGRWDDAQAHLKECFQLMETMGDLRGQADVPAGLGYLALQQQDVATAVSHLRNSLHWYAELMPQTTESKIRSLTPELVDAILRAALAAVANQQPAQAATLFAAVTRFGSAMNHTPVPPLKEAMEKAETVVQATLSRTKYETAMTTGQRLPLTGLLMRIGS